MIGASLLLLDLVRRVRHLDPELDSREQYLQHGQPFAEASFAKVLPVPVARWVPSTKQMVDQGIETVPTRPVSLPPFPLNPVRCVAAAVDHLDVPAERHRGEALPHHEQWAGRVHALGDDTDVAKPTGLRLRPGPYLRPPRHLRAVSGVQGGDRAASAGERTYLMAMSMLLYFGMPPGRDDEGVRAVGLVERYGGGW